MSLQLLGYTAYTCERCLQHFIAPFGNEQVSCTVLHPPGDCCHYGEMHVDFERFEGDAVRYRRVYDAAVRLEEVDQLCDDLARGFRSLLREAQSSDADEILAAYDDYCTRREVYLRSVAP